MADPSMRSPVVAGRFYPGDRGRLEAYLRDVLGEPLSKGGAKPRAVIVPHAGYIYSGATAAAVYRELEVRGRCLLLGPNHTGMGRGISVSSHHRWQTPLGEVEVDQALSRLLVGELPGATLEPLAHQSEHSLEVQLPFLQWKSPSLRIAAVSFSSLSLERCREVGRGLARVLLSQPEGEEITLVISTDMSHFLNAREGERLDRLAIERVLAMDPEGLYDVVSRFEITMCGVIPTTIALFALRETGEIRPRLVDYTHSGMVSGDDERVVGYAGLVLEGLE